jgi:hypothetical protein
MSSADCRVVTIFALCLAVLSGNQAGVLAASPYQDVPIPSDAALTGAASPLPVPAQVLRGPVPLSQSLTPAFIKPGQAPLPARQAHQFVPQLGTYSSDPATNSITQPLASARTTARSTQTPVKHRFDQSLGTYVSAQSGDSEDLLQQAEQLQAQLRSYQVGAASGGRLPAASPAITIVNPTGYGADRGQMFAAISLQARTRYQCCNLGPFRGVRDAGAGVGIGFGNSQRGIGLQASYTSASFGNSRTPFSGGFNAKVHTQFGPGWAAALGGEGIINFGRLGPGSPTEFNDFEGTYYGAITHVLPLRPSITDPFSRLAITAGIGSGRFRSIEQVNNRQFGLGLFGSVALRATPSLSLISEWTGQDLSVGASWVPLRSVPLVLTPAFRDLAGPRLDGPRFVMGVGGSLGNLFTLLDAIF